MRAYIVDSFTQEPFKGNPAGVCFLEQELSEDKMLKIAAELNFSETAFIGNTENKNVYTIRFFSPKKEIPLCGHATLASSKVIFENTGAAEIHFINIENIDLVIKRRGEEIIMEFPVYDTIPAEAPPGMTEALGITTLNNTAYINEKKIFLLEIDDAGALSALTPDFTALVASCNYINGVLVTAPGNNGEYDYYYRYFWPWAGTNEDPVTGGIQTFLAKYWGKRLDKKTMKAFQPSSRTGYMGIELQDDKVLIAGYAVILLQGDFLV